MQYATSTWILVLVFAKEMHLTPLWPGSEGAQIAKIKFNSTGINQFHENVQIYEQNIN